MSYINRESVKLKLRRYLMPNVEPDGMVSVENAERYFLKLLDEETEVTVENVRRCPECRYSRPMMFKTFYYCRKYKTTRTHKDYCSRGIL